MTRRQRLAIRLPVGCRVVCLDATDPIGLLGQVDNGMDNLRRAVRKEGPAAELVWGQEYVVSHHEQGVACPLIRLRGFNSTTWFAPSRFARAA